VRGGYVEKRRRRHIRSRIEAARYRLLPVSHCGVGFHGPSLWSEGKRRVCHRRRRGSPERQELPHKRPSVQVFRERR
jgi:hypothetical protein